MIQWWCLWCDVTWNGDRVCWMCFRSDAVVTLYSGISLADRSLANRTLLEKGKVG